MSDDILPPIPNDRFHIVREPEEVKEALRDIEEELTTEERLQEEVDVLKERIEELESKIDELENDLENMTREKDEQYDRAENLSEELDGLQGKVDSGELQEIEEDEAEALDIARDLKVAYERLQMGTLTEIDNIIELTNKLIGLYL